MMTKQNLHSDLAISPGEYLLEVLEELGMNQADLARRMGRPMQSINEIINGHKSITPETALQLEQVTGVPAHIWTGLEDEYRLVLAKQHEKEQLEKEAALLDLVPYKEMAKLQWVKPTSDKLEKVKELWRFFAVASLRNLPDLRVFQPAFRQLSFAEASSYALSAWLRKGEVEAREVSAKPFNAEDLKACLPRLRAMTNDDPELWVPEAKELLTNCGVVFVFVPHLPKTYVNGATFWLSPEKVVIELSIFRKWADVFWFSLFHELGHVLLHGRRFPNLTPEKKIKLDPEWQKIETEADDFARNTLIPPRYYNEFLENGIFSPLSIQAFGELIGVHPGIIVGRLQHDKYLDYSQMNDLKMQYADS